MLFTMEAVRFPCGFSVLHLIALVHCYHSCTLHTLLDTALRGRDYVPSGTWPQILPACLLAQNATVTAENCQRRRVNGRINPSHTLNTDSHI